MTDINIGAITEALNDKTDRDLRNVDTTAKADAVIDYQEPTAKNNYTWYRKYRSGWVEQGGWVSSKLGSVTFPIRMSETNQYTAAAVHNGNKAKGEGVIHCYNKTATGMTVGVSISDSGMAYFSWVVFGISA